MVHGNANRQLNDEGTEGTQDSDAEDIDISQTQINEQVPHALPKSNIVTPKAKTTGLKRKADHNIDAVKEAVTSLQQIVSTNNVQVVEDEFTLYGKHIAAQLRELPLVNALRLQEQIQSLITQERISCLSATNTRYTRLIEDTLTAESASSAYTSRPSTSFSHASYSDYGDDLVYHNLQTPNEHV